MTVPLIINNRRTSSTCYTINMNGRSIKVHRIPAAILLIIFLCFIIFYIFGGTKEQRLTMDDILKNESKINMRKLLIGAVQAAQRGGLEILEVAKTRDLKEKSKGKTDEGANDPFTEADGRSHCVMKQGLHRIFPRVIIFSEEDEESCAEAKTFDLDPTVLHETAHIPDELINIEDVTVWIDPLDATIEFTEQLYEYVTTMVCVAVSGKPVIGVIHSPFIGQTAWAWVGQSVMSEYLSSIHSQTHTVDHPIITISRSHPGHVKDLIHAVFGEKSNIVSAAGAGYKVLQLVANNATAYLHSTSIKKWDICAGDAILTALGGTLTSLDGQPIYYGPDELPTTRHGLLATLDNHLNYIHKMINYINLQDIRKFNNK